MSEKPRKHSVTLHGHRTSISLEPAFWAALRALAVAEDRSLDGLVAEIDAERTRTDPTLSLTSAIRVRLLAEARRGRC